MKFIGITGGVGAGKSAILDYLDSKPDIRVMLADNIAHDIMEPGTLCYNEIKNLFDDSIFEDDGHINKNRMAAAIFNDSSLRDRLNAIVHPAVKEYVIEQYEYEKKAGKNNWLILEAALLIEEHYDEICDELWYIYTSRENRRARLKASRGYSDARVDEIFASQLTEEAYRRHCSIVIDNNGTIEETIAQTKAALQTLEKKHIEEKNI